MPKLTIGIGGTAPPGGSAPPGSPPADPSISEKESKRRDDPCEQLEVVDMERLQVTQGTDLEQVRSVPSGAKRVTVWMTTNDGSGNPVPVHCELAWLDFQVAIAGNEARDTADKMILIRDRDLAPSISAYTYAGPSGEGERVRMCPSKPNRPCQLYLFVAGSELASGQKATLMLEWRRE